MGIGTCARGHTTAHHGGGIHLTTGAGGGHVSGHLLRHTRLSAGLAGIMSHAGGGHVMTWRHSRVLLHTAGMKTAWHSHHVGKIILWVDDPPEWIIDAPALLALSYVEGKGRQILKADAVACEHSPFLLWRHDVTYDVSCQEAQLGGRRATGR